MGKGLNKTELTGIILLAILVVGITAAAMLMKNRTVEDSEPPVETRILDAAVSGETTSSENQNLRKGKSKKRGARKNTGAGVSSKKSKNEEIQYRGDPFTDTIPLDWEDPFNFFPD